MTWRVEIDRDVCIGSGMCAGMAPDVFELENERSRAVAEEIDPQEAALDAADSCPALAITLLDEDGEVVGPRP
ncbi:ferredoxin [Streptomyces diacarni]|uniref:Ferredoxin n=2 Tax=Streptomyces TaxID=1883 RepID=A0A367FBB6_9ACTN|nr:MULTISPECIES: ferredoxin [Streptomyces]RCG27162.1 ferredoxin [Streptomyces diacarni]UNS95462.1 ferredoxin [Streptomyces tubbatahanensis]